MICKYFILYLQVAFTHTHDRNTYMRTYIYTYIHMRERASNILMGSRGLAANLLIFEDDPQLWILLHTLPKCQDHKWTSYCKQIIFYFLEWVLGNINVNFGKYQLIFFLQLFMLLVLYPRELSLLFYFSSFLLFSFSFFFEKRSSYILIIILNSLYS